jgi:hypothetical protein
MRLAIMLTLALAGCVTPGAQSLGPRTASDLVTLLGGAPATGGCSAAERPIDRRTLADGSAGPFTVPAGKVLVLTGVEWSSSGTGTGRSVVVTVLHRTALGAQTLFMSHALSTPTGAGYAGTQSAIPHVVVKPGVPLCVTQYIDSQPAGGSPPGAVILHGFLTDDL